ncbi:phage holin family protein [Streptomyces sp. NBC_01190]|uniref:phage holin family protein n=1 Tax=Streptomyces sp. NBC_01190 TaxID=2903767 RepID=UPI003866EF31|nr:phage holin family protein [Streptomyces sp. NBC_01190]
MSPAPEHDGDGRSIGQLFAAATAEVSALVHDEIALAKAELRADAKRAAMGSAALVVALALAVFAMPMGSLALAYVIHRSGLPLDASFGIVFGGFVLVAVVLILLAIGRFKKVKKPELSITSAKETAAVLQKAKPHPRPAEPTDAKAIEAKM